MDLKIIKEEQNPLFNRKEIIATTIKEVVPKREEVMRALSEKYSIPLDTIRILTINGSFGSKEFTIKANIYPSNKERNEYEKLTEKEKQLDEKLAAKPEPKEETKEAPETKTPEVSETKEAKTEEKTPEAVSETKTEEKLNEKELQT